MNKSNVIQIKKMDWRIVGRKALQGAATGAAAALPAVIAGGASWWAILISAAVVGGLDAGFNAIKQIGKGK